MVVEKIQKYVGVLAKHKLSKPEAAKQDVVPKQEMKIVLHKTPEIPKVVPVTISPECRRTLLEALLLDLVQVKQRLVMYVADGHLWLVLQRLGGLLTGRVTVARGPGSGLQARLVWVEGQPQPRPQTQPHPKETEPAPVILPELQKKKDSNAPMKTEKSEVKTPQKNEKSDNKPPIMSNLLETIQENSPAWQKSISNSFGEWQKLVVEKMSK